MIFLDILYLFSAMSLAIYGLNSLLLTWFYWRGLKTKENKQGIKQIATNNKPFPSSAEWPNVTVQLPIYNERYVVERVIKAATNLNWPADHLQIQILDDSTDDTQHIVANAITHCRNKGAKMAIEHIHRKNRQGFKAGALENGLASASGTFIAIFDADFVPPPDFLEKTIPLFKDKTVGCVQTCWGHINPKTSKLTQAQALGIDGHFIVEQFARHTIKTFLNFNGTAGIWRRTCMNSAGGWAGDTLTEDLDLSYRAQLQGWQIVYETQVIVPAEIPVQLNAFKRQQFRWAKGSIQTAFKLMGQLWRAPKPLWLKLLSTLHLTNYAVHPLMLLNLLLTLPITFSDSIFLQLAPLFIFSAIGPPILYWTTMRSKSMPIWACIEQVSLLIALGTGLSVNNSKAVFEAILGIDSEFKRTPKFAITHNFSNWQGSTYVLPHDPSVWVELVLAIYTFGLLIWVINLGIWWLIPWLVLYFCGYSYISAQAFIQA